MKIIRLRLPSLGHRNSPWFFQMRNPVCGGWFNLVRLDGGSGCNQSETFRSSGEAAPASAGIPARQVHVRPGCATLRDPSADCAPLGARRVGRPDFAGERPKVWSYRDLVFLRFFAWLRAKRMTPTEAAARVTQVRALLVETNGNLSVIYSDGRSVFVEGEKLDHVTHAQALTGLARFLGAPSICLHTLTRTLAWEKASVYGVLTSCIRPPTLLSPRG